MRSGGIRTNPARVCRSRAGLGHRPCCRAGFGRAPDVLPFSGGIRTRPAFSGEIQTEQGPRMSKCCPKAANMSECRPKTVGVSECRPAQKSNGRRSSGNAVSDWVRQFNPAQLSPCHIPRYERSASSVALPSRRPTWYTWSRIAGSFTESGVLTDSLGRITNTLPSRSNRASSSSCAL